MVNIHFKDVSHSFQWKVIYFNVRQDAMIFSLKKQNFWMTQVLFVESLFWTSGDVYPGCQNRGGCLACVHSQLTNEFIRFTSGVTPANCKWSAWKPSPFDPRTCRHVHMHWWGSHS